MPTYLGLGMSKNATELFYWHELEIVHCKSQRIAHFHGHSVVSLAFWRFKEIKYVEQLLRLLLHKGKEKRQAFRKVRKSQVTFWAKSLARSHIYKNNIGFDATENISGSCKSFFTLLKMCCRALFSVMDFNCSFQLVFDKG